MLETFSEFESFIMKLPWLEPCRIILNCAPVDWLLNDEGGLPTPFRFLPYP